jgi:hypothetical protein
VRALHGIIPPFAEEAGLEVNHVVLPEERLQETGQIRKESRFSGSVHAEDANDQTRWLKKAPHSSANLFSRKKRISTMPAEHTAAHLPPTVGLQSPAANGLEFLGGKTGQAGKSRRTPAGIRIRKLNQTRGDRTGGFSFGQGFGQNVGEFRPE